MPQPQQLPAPEFSRPLAPEVLARHVGSPLTGEADPAERAALAARFSVPAVLGLSYVAHVSPWGRGGWRVQGTADALLEQVCVVSLEPVQSRVHEGFDRRFLPDALIEQPPPGSEIELGAEDADAPEGLGETIDLGEIAAEAIALGIDPYPRRDGVSVGQLVVAPAGAEPLTDEAARPFARLAALRQQKGRE